MPAVAAMFILRKTLRQDDERPLIIKNTFYGFARLMLAYLERFLQEEWILLGGSINSHVLKLMTKTAASIFI